MVPDGPGVSRAVSQLRQTLRWQENGAFWRLCGGTLRKFYDLVFWTQT